MTDPAALPPATPPPDAPPPDAPVPDAPVSDAPVSDVEPDPAFPVPGVLPASSSAASSSGASSEAEVGARLAALRRECTVIVSGVRQLTMRDRLAELDVDGPPDAYGDGPVAELEARVAELLGKPAAVFFPTGTMAQQVALRCWAERTGSATVALHPLAHLEVHERGAFRTLTGLRPVWPTTQARPPTAEEVRSLDEPFGTLMMELPLRDAGFLLPTWDELVAVTEAGRARGARVHFDGARLWETTVHFGQDLPTIAGLADSVYVSFYKTLAGLSGAALAGPTDFVAQARAWRHRYGGNVYQQWPAALMAMAGIRNILPQLDSYVEHARVVAALLAELPGARVYPAVPHTHQFQLWLPHPAAALNDAALALAEQEKIWFAGGWHDMPPTGYAMTEVTVAAPAVSLSPAEITSVATRFLSII